MEARIRAARGRGRSAATPADEDAADDGPARGTGMGLGLRIGLEMVVTVLVGAGIGYLLDLWLGTAPILMVVFLFLGAAAGVSTVYRVVRGLDEAVGLGRAIEAKEREEAARRAAGDTADPEAGKARRRD
nr:AtpZ/AtpI family protein [Roseospira goensis]